VIHLELVSCPRAIERRPATTTHKVSAAADVAQRHDAMESPLAATGGA